MASNNVIVATGVPPGPKHSPAMVLKTNFYGLRELTQKLLAKMSKGSAIVNLTSGAGMGWAQNIPLLLLDPDYEWINGATIPAERGAIIYGGIAKAGLG